MRLERTVSWSQTRRDTNFAIPGYSISAIIPRQGGKSKIFLSVVIYVVKAAFVPLSAAGAKPANARVARLRSVSTYPVPDTATALPKQARYQLRYTRLFSLFIRLVVFSQTRRDTNFAIPGYSISAIIPRREGKSEIFLPVGKADSIPFSVIGGNPANAGVTRLCGVSPYPIPNTTTALPNHPRYQLR